MAKQNSKSAADDMQTLFDPRGYQNVFKTWASFNERMSTIAIDAMTKSTEIATEATQQSLSNLRDITAVRDEPAEYGQAYSDFVQKQADLLMRTGQSLGEVSQKAGSETSELASTTGEEMAGKVATDAKSASDRATSAAKKAA